MTAVGIALVVVTSVAAALVGDRALDPDFRRHVRARLRARRLRQHRERATLPDPYTKHRRRELERLRRRLLARRSRELRAGYRATARRTEEDLAHIDAEIASLDGSPFAETEQTAARQRKAIAELSARRHGGKIETNRRDGYRPVRSAAPKAKPPGPSPISPGMTSAAFGELRRHLLASQPRVGD